MRRLMRENAADLRVHFYYEDVLFSFWCLKDPHCALCPPECAERFSAMNHALPRPRPAAESPSDGTGGSNGGELRAWGFHRNWRVNGEVADERPMLCETNDRVRRLNRKTPAAEISCNDNSSGSSSGSSSSNDSRNSSSTKSTSSSSGASDGEKENVRADWPKGYEL